MGCSRLFTAHNYARGNMSESEKNPGDSGAKEHIRVVLQIVTRALVDRPEELNVTITQGEQTCVYEVRCAQKDTGKLVGKKGAMAEALRTIIKSLSAKNRVRAILEICD